MVSEKFQRTTTTEALGKGLLRTWVSFRGWRLWWESRKSIAPPQLQGNRIYRVLLQWLQRMAVVVGKQKIQRTTTEIKLERLSSSVATGTTTTP